MLLRIIAIVSIFFGFQNPLTANAAIQLCADTDNAYSAKLVGTWKLDKDLSRQLGAPLNPDKNPTTLTFTNEAKQFDHFSAKLRERPHVFGACAYLAGVMTGETEVDQRLFKVFSSPFVGAQANGNPIVVYDERGYAGSGPIKDAHVGHFVIVNPNSKDPKSDLLFVGGDHAHEGKIIYRREN